MSENSTAIEANNLSKTFSGGVAAVSGLDLSVPHGVVYGLVGRNGAGKTTLIRMLMGLLRPTGGNGRILGQDLWRSDPTQRQRIGYVSQMHKAHEWMTISELCCYLGHFYEKWDQPYARSLAKRFSLPWDRQIGLLSGGQQRKVAILLAFSARPEVLMLDEPAAGLDPIARRELIDETVDVIASISPCTVFFSTHILSDLERVAEYVGIMDRGRIVTEARLDDLQNRTKRVQVVFNSDAIPDGFEIPGAIRTKVEGPVVTSVVRMVSETQLDELHKRPDLRVNVFPLGLEEIFIDLFGPEARGEFGDMQL
ncbi:MAG: ABC transporter ATP-binding protein [Phycisphaerae bacterium]|jgi:ABC-2 type transport system ATP-binding protein|nr:ABC transporter ATP-binding protein [Phycisphaerae bacterium]